TAAVKSMLQSGHNFFFVAAEPGGSVTVDKPPLGLWIEAAFAFVLGVSGFSVSLPNILAGVFSIPLVFSMVKKHAGELAGLIAGLVMTFTPIFVATNRNNTMDGLLVFFLLLAAWVFVRATETGRARWVMVGAFIVGLGFNVKMLQAFLPLPAFYALYFFGSKEGWVRKLLNLGLATVLLAVVSLSWAVAVDLPPADQRPYIGSSGDNTVMGLITGHNGGARLFGGGGNPNGGANPNGFNPADQGNLPGNPPQQAVDACTGQTLGAACSFDLPNQTINGTCITPPQLNQLVCAPQTAPQNGIAGQNGPGQPNGPGGQNAPDGQNLPGAQGGPQGGPGGTPFSQETGTPGVFRFFTTPLSKQMSWLLPFALISLGGIAFAGMFRMLKSGVWKAFVLWGGWLGTCLVFLSAISGIFHAYYTIMLVPALGAVVGIGVAQFWQWGRDLVGVGTLFGTATLLTLFYQAFALSEYSAGNGTMIIPAALFVLGLILLAPPKTRAWAYASLFTAMLVIPVYWTTLTVINNPNGSLPTAFEGGTGTGQSPDPRARPFNGPANGGANSELLTYLESHTADVEYLVAVPSAQTGAPMVIATGRPVLYMGGFGGQDEVVTADDLTAMVANGDLRFVLYGSDRGNKQEIQTWLDSACTVVEGINVAEQQNPNGQGNQGLTLYQCGQ
ncbi:MAG TPA: glycosyltransferase family 39 protein, partial [Anaerolineales bacterium]|nr:glycosyltransferase family 39 protein [Anaerolineales bacterium]